MSKFHFPQFMPKEQADSLIGKVYFETTKRVEEGKPFVVDFKEDKSPKQLRGYWRLAGLIEPYLKNDYDNIGGREDVSDFIKVQCGYIKEVKTKTSSIVLGKSLTVATKRDLMELIEKLMFVCEFYGLKDYELRPQEQKEIEDYEAN